MLDTIGSTIADLNDFSGKRLVSTAGTTDLKAITQKNNEHLTGIDISSVPDHGKGIEMVEKGQADGFALDDVILCGLIAGRPDPARLKVVGKYLTIDPLGIMLPKSDPEFRQLVDDKMKRLIRAHEINPIYNRWFTEPIPPRNRSLNMPLNYLTRDFLQYPTSVLIN